MSLVKIYSTRSGSLSEFSTNAATWGVLREELVKAGLFNPTGMRAVELNSKKSLENDAIEIPQNDENYVITLIPTKSKAGAQIVYKVTEETINEIVDELESLIDTIRDSLTANPDESELLEIRQRVEALLRGSQI